VLFSSSNKVFAQSGLGVIEERLQAAYKKVSPAIVKFSYGNTWLGSGVIVTPEGHIIVGGVTMSDSPSWFSTSHRFHAGTCSVFDLDGRLLGLNTQTPIGGDPIHTNAANIVECRDDLVAGKNLDRARRTSVTMDESHPLARLQQKSRVGDAKPIELATTEKALAATVRIRERVKEKGGWSGVIVTPDGHVITCGHHGKRPGTQLTISLADGRDARARVWGTHLQVDIGLVKIIDNGPWPYAKTGRSATIQPGDPCKLVGYPVAKPGREPWTYNTTFKHPSFTLPARDDWSAGFWTSRYPPDIGGISGGGVFDKDGRLVGVVRGGSQMPEEDKGDMQH